MLIGFKVQNFRSFQTEQAFSYLTSSDRMHEATHLMRTGMRAVPRVSKAAIIFGPNGSGKTNLLLAIAVFRDLILHSAEFSAAQFAERHTPFRSGAAASGATEFEIDVLLNRVRYRYSVAYDAERIISERLLVYRTGKSQRWFERHFDGAQQREVWAPFSPNFNGPREMWRKATGATALFLTTATKMHSAQLAPLSRWMEHCLHVLLPAETLDLRRVAIRLHDTEFKNRMVDLLQSAGLRISDLEPPASPPALAATSGGIQFKYDRGGSESVWLDAAVEAAGTRRLVALLAHLLDALDHGKLLMIDEFDTSLHPLVARFLVRRINDPSVSSHGAQLLLTSHNTTLMDLDFLRRDEIWFAQLNDNHTTSLSPLKRSGPRKRELIAKNYLKGRYGALPQIRSSQSGR